jgi:hypothetical protein
MRYEGRTAIMNFNPMNHDEEQLKLLAIFHYVVAGAAALFSLFPCFYVVFGLVVLYGPSEFAKPGQNPPPAFLGWIMIIMGGVLIMLGLTLAALVLAAGRSLARRKRFTFCVVMAAVECLFMPFGTVLGVFTIVVLNRDSVKALFAAAPLPPPE